MHTKKYLVSTLLASSIIFGGSGLTPAQGQEQVLAPQGSWSISKVDRTAQGGNSYCTLSRKYDDGVVLSLARNMAEEYSLALDFQKQTFEKDKSLKISLQPGPGKLRAYDLMPASDKAVVIRLGWDEGFFETLDQSQNMKVKIADNSYSFAMPLIAKGQADLEDCMDGLKSAAKGSGNTNATASKDVLNAEPVQTSKAFDAGRVGTPGSDAVALNAEKESVTAQENKVLHDFASSMEDQEKTASVTKKSNFNKVASAPAAAKKMADVAAAPVNLMPQETAAKTSAAAEPASGVQAASNAAEIASLQKQIASLNAENTKLQSKASAPSPQTTAQIAAYEKRIADMKAENAALKQKADDTKAKADIAALEKRIADVTAQNTALQAKASTLSPQTTAQITTLEKRIADMTSDMDALKKKAAENNSQAEIAALEKRIADVTAKNAALQAKTSAPSPQTTAQITTLEKRIADMTSDMDALKKKAAENNSQAEIAALEKHIADMTSENAALQTKANAPSPQVTAQIAELQKSLGDLRAENAGLKAKTSTAAAAPENAAAIAGMVKQIKDLNAQNAELKTKVSAIVPQDTAKTAELEKRINDVLAENAQLKSKAVTPVAANAAPADAAKMTELQKQIATLVSENADLKTKAAATQVASAAPAAGTNGIVDDLKAKNKSLQEKLDAISLENSQKPDAADVADAMGKAKELEAKNAQLQESLRQAQTRIAETAVNTEGKSLKTLTELEVKLEAAQKDNLALAKQLDDVRLKQDDGRLAVVAGDWNLEKATKRLNEGEREVRRLGQQLEQQRMSCNQEKSKIEQMLFDPAVTDQKQIEKLTELETQLKAYQEKDPAKLAQLGNGKAEELATQNAILQSRIAELEQNGAGAAPSTTITAMPDSLAEQKLAALQKTSAQMKQDTDKLRDENIVLKTQAEKLRLQLADAGSGAAAKSDRDASASLAMEDLRRDAALKASQNITYQNQLAALQQENGQLKNRLVVTGGSRDAVASTRPAAKFDRTSMNGTTIASIEPASGAPAVKAEPAVAKGSYDASTIQSLLKKAGVGVGSVTKASAGLSGADNYGWADKSGVKGFSSVKTASSGEFDSLVKQYIAYQKSQCGGDFASMPSPSTGSAGKKMALYEVACVSPQQSLSSSLVFFEDGGRFVAIANQIAADDMDIAMDSRDKIAGAVKGL